MPKKKSGYSKKSKDWLGRTVIDHYNNKGEKTGNSKRTKDFWGNSVTERFNTKGEKTGYSKPAKTFFGNEITERFNSKGEKVGYNKKGQTLLGDPVTERYNMKGEKIGHSVKATTFWGTPITQHYDHTTSSRNIPGRDRTGSSGDYDTSTTGTNPSSSSFGWLWVVGIVIVAGIVLRSGILDSLIAEHSVAPVASDAPRIVVPNAPGIVKPYSTTKFIGRDARTGRTTIDATADEIGAAQDGWFSIITGGMKQQIFLRKEYPDIDLGDRLRITYDEHVPEQVQGPAGTAAYVSGVIVSMVIIRHEDSADQTTKPLSSEVRIDNGRLLPTDGGLEDPGFTVFRNELLAAVARKDAQFLRSVLAPDVKIGFGFEPDNSSEFERKWKIESPDSQIWTKLDGVLELGGRFETWNGERVFCAPYLCGTWPQKFDPFSYVAVIAAEVQLRSSPDDSSESLAKLSYNVVRLIDWTQDRQWAQVAMPNGTSGFVQAEYVRSPIDYRATFRKLDGKWVISAFLAGD